MDIQSHNVMADILFKTAPLMNHQHQNQPNNNNNNKGSTRRLVV